MKKEHLKVQNKVIMNKTSVKHFTALDSHSAQLVNAIDRHVSLAVLPLVVGLALS